MDTKIIKKAIVIGITVLFLATMGMAILGRNMPAFAVGVTIYVDDDNTTGPWDGTLAHPYQNITSGMVHASNGDTVYVYSGTYSENFVVNKSITLTGESKPVIDGMGGIGARGINIIVNNVTVESFNITNSHYGIYCNASGFSIIDNVFWYDTYGFYWTIDKINLAEDYTVHTSTVESNEFYMNTNYDAVYVYVSLDYKYTGFYDVVIGDITVCKNTFHMDGITAPGIELDGGIYVTDLYGGTVSVGTLNASGNTMYGGGYGIDFYGHLDDVQDVEASVGDVIVNDNVLVNQSSGGIYIDYYDATYWDRNTVGTYGDLIVRGNTITSAYSADGIYISDIGYWEYFDGNASLEVGNVYIEENEIDVGDYGIEFYGYDVGYEMNDNSSLTIGDILVNDNTINSDDYGIYVDCEYFGEYMYGNSSVTMDNIEFSGNIINSTYYGIYIYELAYEFGYSMYGNSSFAMGHILVNNIIINSGYEGIYVEYVEYLGTYVYGTSTFTMGNIEFSGNTINSTYEGIYIQSFYHAYYMYDNASFAIGDIFVSDNIINSEGDGVFLREIYHHTRFGYNAIDNATIITGNVKFSQNEIVGNRIDGNSGMNLADLENATIKNNQIQNCSYGIYLLNSNNNSIYHNIFNNTINAYDNGTNTWDNGYPSGGNYWSEYNGTDYFSGPGQNITGSDGIGDTPYDIEIDNQDRYPFTTQWAWDQTPPSITNISQNPEIPDNLEIVTVTLV